MPSTTPSLPLYYSARLPERALGCIGFAQQPTNASLLTIDTGLTVLSGPPLREVMGRNGSPQHDAALEVRYAQDGEFLLGAVSIAETGPGDISAAAYEAYRRISCFNERSDYPHLIRLWNYMDDINRGEGDQERYKQFCTGRARGWSTQLASFPAASALGRPTVGRPTVGHAQSNGTLLVYWLAGKQPAISLENPRQVSAFQYPREYGPTAPSFARASLLANGLLMISGTASIVGHASQHTHDVIAQTHETLNNLEALITHARQQAPQLPATLGAHSLLKIYVRHPEHAALIEQTLRTRCPVMPPLLMLHAEVCRRELLMEMDCVHGLPAGTPTA